MIHLAATIAATIFVLFVAWCLLNVFVGTLEAWFGPSPPERETKDDDYDYGDWD